MTLHEAIAHVLRQKGHPKTAREIAEELNKNRWYKKADNSEIKANQILARVDDHHELFEIDRTTSPLKIILIGNQTKKNQVLRSVKEPVKKITEISPIYPNSSYSKTSFEPISNSNTQILILGTMPGDKSLELKEYYGHNRNNFWKIISTITNNDLPISYADKVALLTKAKIGIWDVAHRVNRKGSLDSAIQNEEPNDLNGFISKHKNLRVIGFNGVKAENLFSKFFTKKSEIKYICLPSTSPANTGIGFQSICKLWKEILG